MVLLPTALEQGLIGSLLDHGVLEPDSSTILVNSSTNSGTPSDCATTCPTTTAGSALRCATRPITSAAWRRGKRGSVIWVRYERPVQGGLKSARKVNSTRTHAVGP